MSVVFFDKQTRKSKSNDFSQN